MQSAQSPDKTPLNNEQSSVSSSEQPLSLKRSSDASVRSSGRKRKLSFKAREAVREAFAAKFGNDETQNTSSLDSTDSHKSPRSCQAKKSFTPDPYGKHSQDGKRSQGRFNQGSSSERAQDRAERLSREVVNLQDVFETDVPVGKIVKLPVSEIIEQGAMVDAMNLGQLFIPNSQLPDELEVGDELRVFIYNDRDRFCATCKHPILQLGMVGLLRINDINRGTIYLDMGVPKDLVVPISEQRLRRTPRVGDNMLILVAIDNQGRLYGTQAFNRFIRDEALPNEFKPQQPAKIVATATTPLGFRVIIDDKVYGLIYDNEQKGELVLGKRYDGFVKCVRPDGRVDATLQEVGRIAIDHAAQDILQALGYSDGFLNFNDKSDPQLIADFLHMSKSKFKKAVGSLYKARLIEVLDDGIKLTPQGLEAFNAEHSKESNSVLAQKANSLPSEDILQDAQDAADE